MGYQSSGQITSLMQVAVSGMVTVMTLNIFATSLGMIMAASEGLEVAPIALKATDPAIEDLRKTYGESVVRKALGDVPGADAVELAHRIEFYMHRELREKYGDYAANQAIISAPPGDLGAAVEIAKSLSESKVSQGSPPSVKAKAVAEGKARGRANASPQKDTKTGVEYRSKCAAGAAVAAEYGLDPTNTYIWYEVIKRDPDRFIPV